MTEKILHYAELDKYESAIVSIQKVGVFWEGCFEHCYNPPPSSEVMKLRNISFDCCGRCQTKFDCVKAESMLIFGAMESNQRLYINLSQSATGDTCYIWNRNPFIQLPPICNHCLDQLFNFLDFLPIYNCTSACPYC